MRVTHISIIHKALDIRIFAKECRTLAAAGYDVHLVAGGVSGELDGVHVHPVASDEVRPRASRQGPRLWRAARWAFRLRPSVFHLHDPHLIPLGLALKLARARVVYDVHENYPAHARTKLHDRPLRGRLKALMWTMLEATARRAFDGFVCTSPAVAERFPEAITVGNFPMHREFDPKRANGSAPPYAERPNRLIYTGAIAEVRAVDEMMRALELLPREIDCRLRLVGYFKPDELERAARAHPAWRRVDHLPWRPHARVIPELLGARVGLALLHPLPNHVDAIRSNKLFEYMAAGLPVIASDLPRWREIVRGLDCGLVVDPRDPEAIAAAIEYLLTHPEEAEAMGRRGRAAVTAQFNWDGEAARLLALYGELAGAPPAAAGDGSGPGAGASVIAA